MRRHILVAGLAAAALIPSFANAQSSCEEQRNTHVAATVVGVGAGAAIGNAVAPRGSRGVGTVLGAIGGGLIGSQASQPDPGCNHAYGYYDRASNWHANNVGPGMAQGYYDRDGGWVNGAPNGHYDQGGRWMASNQTGYYDQGGRWNAGPANGAYDAHGRWMPGAVNGHRDATGVWVADAQPGYYDRGGRWHAGEVQGRYDDRGVWTAAAVNTGVYASDASYEQPRRDLASRESWIENRIHRASDKGALSSYDARRALDRLNHIRQREADLRDRRGRLSGQDEAMLQGRLDRLSDSLRQLRDEPNRY